MIAERVKPKAEWYQWLLTYQEICNEIEFLEFELSRSKVELKRWTSGDLMDVKLQEDSLGAKVEENIEKLEDRIALKTEQRNELLQLVDTFKGLDHKILKLKYVKGLTLEDIAYKLSYSQSHIRKRHAELVKTIKFLRMYHFCSLND